MQQQKQTRIIEMMLMRCTLAMLCVVGIVGCVRSAPEEMPAQPDAFAVMEEFQRLGTADLWPGFDPARTPIMIYDGERTILFNHPAVPTGFTSLSSRQGVSAMLGRHPSVTANSSAVLEGVQTATVLLQRPVRSATSAASLAIHEAFHVFQREKHPSWTANEVELFTFPVTDTAVVMRQRLETEALRRALTTRDSSRSACWAAAAMSIRGERFGSLPKGVVAYERGSELNEGIATYVEKRALGVPDSLILPSSAFAAGAVRQRSYSTGLAIARLLDRFAPQWRMSMQPGDSLPLDMLLASAITRQQPAPRCEFSAAERDSVQIAAMESVDSLRHGREQARLRFITQPGWTLVVQAQGGSPLFPQGFDPLNVQMLTDGEVLHTRFVKLGSDRGTIEVLDRSALTTPAGAHPMFNGLRSVTVAGLPADLTVSRTASGVSARATGLQLDLRNVIADTSGKVISVRMLP